MLLAPPPAAGGISGGAGRLARAGRVQPCRRHDPVTVGPWAGADPPVKRLGSDSCVRLTDAAARTWPLVGADGAEAPGRGRRRIDDQLLHDCRDRA